MSARIPYWCWKKGTQRNDGARFKATSRADAIAQFCAAWNLEEDEVNCEDDRGVR